MSPRSFSERCCRFLSTAARGQKRAQVERLADRTGPATRPTLFPPLEGGHEARRIIFLCDSSGSILNKFATLRRELLNEVDSLAGIQEFNIIFWAEQGPVLMEHKLVRADEQRNARATKFLDAVVTRGETNPVPGIEAAFAQKPELIYLVTDGDFPDNQAVINRIAALNKEHKVKVSTTAFVSEADTDTAFYGTLKRIAAENGGVYSRVEEKDLGR